MSWEEIAKILQVANLLGIAGLGVLHLYLRDKFVTKKDYTDARTVVDGRMSGQADRLNGLDKRLAVIEEELRHLPTADDFAALTHAVSNVSAAQAASAATLSSVAASLTRVEDYLLRHKP